MTRLALIFFFSGFASIIYQVTWQRVFTLYYGVGPSWITLTVSAFMLGLGLGALVGGHLAEKRDSTPLRIYCAFELCLGLFGLASLPVLHSMGMRTAGASPPQSFCCIFAFLLIPTTLMGTTLPLLVKLANDTLHDISRSVSELYFANTLGAAAGALAASFVLISLGGLDVAVQVAAVINFALALAVWRLRRGGQSGLEAGKVTGPIPPDSDPVVGLSLIVLVTGFVAIGYELLWFRIVAVLVKDSPYAFSCLLFVYLLGLALGSYALGRYVLPRVGISRRDLFFILQGLTGLYVLSSVALYQFLTRHTPFQMLTRASFSCDVHPSMASTFSMGTLWSFLDIFLWPAYFVLIPTLLMGACFPLQAHLIQQSPEKAGQAVARVFFFTILGNVVGGLVTGFFILPRAGTEVAVLGFGVVQLVALAWITDWVWLKRRKFVIIAICSVVAFFACPGPGELYKTMHGEQFPNATVYLSEGEEGVVATFVSPDQQVVNFINGLKHGGRPGYFFYAEAIETLSVPRKLKNVLVIGYGTGSLVETILKVPEVEHVTLVELNATLMQNLGAIPLFQPLLSDPRLRLVVDDGRRYLLNSHETYDAILMDPLRTTTAYSNNLYSKELYQLLKAHMGSESALMVWHNEPRVIPSTVHAAFSHVNHYEIPPALHFMVASPDPITSNSGRKEALLQAFPEEARKHILASPPRQVTVEEATLSRPGYINTDYRPIAEYYCGLPVRDALRR